MNRNKAPRKGPSVVREFKKACDDLAELVNEQLFDGCRKWYWIGDGLTYDEYAEWREANLDNGRYINLKSWLKGARHSMMKYKKANNE